MADGKFHLKMRKDGISHRGWISISWTLASPLIRRSRCIFSIHSTLRLGGLKVQRCLPSFGILKSKYPYCSATSNRTENNNHSLVLALINTILALEGSLYCIVALLAFGHRGFLVFELVDFVALRGIGMMDQNCHG